MGDNVLSLPTDLIKAIRGGQLREVVAVLDAGAPVELHDGKGDPGLPLAMACFMGHTEIVRELILRGATANLPDNNAPTSPLSMALRGGKKDVVKVLIELGVIVPEGMETGLTEQELMVARWQAERFGAVAASQHTDDDEPVIEEIQMVGCYGTDTSVLEADVMRAAREMAEKKNQS